MWYRDYSEGEMATEDDFGFLGEAFDTLPMVSLTTMQG
jgi:hypothetical protein